MYKTSLTVKITTAVLSHFKNINIVHLTKQKGEDHYTW